MKVRAIARYGEVHLKGRNRGIFLNTLTQNLRTKLGNDCKVELTDGRYLFGDFDDHRSDIYMKIANTFGITSVSPCVCVPHNEILSFVKYMGTEIEESFRVNVNRADKKFPHTSMEFAAQCGEVILKESPKVRVDLHNPKKIINIDIRENDKAFIYCGVINGVGGLPVGVSGRALVLLSGGIDSPVAAWLASKRGLSVECVHFASPPYTSDMALNKVRLLIGVLNKYCGDIKLHIVPFTKIQEEIKSKCSKEYTITIMRRFMIRIARHIAEQGTGKQHYADCIITGENLAQVASQTIQGITTNNILAGNLPILRPLITYDKNEIIKLAKHIGTYDISIEPHQDCCTVFVPAAPVISPTIKKCEIEERKLDIETLLNTAVQNIV